VEGAPTAESSASGALIGAGPWTLGAPGAVPPTVETPYGAVPAAATAGWAFRSVAAAWLALEGHVTDTVLDAPAATAQCVLPGGGWATRDWPFMLMCNDGMGAGAWG
jgi:hypothetical protein